MSLIKRRDGYGDGDAPRPDVLRGHRHLADRGALSKTRRGTNNGIINDSG